MSKVSRIRMAVGQRVMLVSLDAYLDPTQHEQDEQDENGCWLLDKRS